MVYRGWMLTQGDHARLVAEVEKSGARMLANTRACRLAHHLPGWCPLVSEFTPETKVFLVEADLTVGLQALGWPAYFIKDYAKSLKTSVGSIISAQDRAAQRSATGCDGL